MGHPWASTVECETVGGRIREKTKSKPLVSRVASHEKGLNYFKQALASHWELYHRGEVLHNQGQKINISSL